MSGAGRTGPMGGISFSERIGGQFLDAGGAVFNVRHPDFGARGDGVHDDAPAIRRALEACSDGGTVYFPIGRYHCASPVRLRSYARYLGAGGRASILTGNGGSHPLFFYDAFTEFGEMHGLTFQGAGAGIRSESAGEYLANFDIRHCHFFADLADGIAGNLILSNVEHCTFGYFGTPGERHRHIYSRGDVTGRLSNMNRIRNTHFYQARGSEGCHFEAGYQLVLDSNNFEANNAQCAVRVLGMYGVYLRDNWFERNAGSCEVVLGNDGSGSIGNYVVECSGNWFHPTAGMAQLFELSGAVGSFGFERNIGTGFSGTRITSYNGNADAAITTFGHNHLLGYSGDPLAGR